MASSWLDSWGNAWGDAWGQQATDPNALRGTIAGSASAAATMSAVAWLSGSSAGISTAQAYLELDGESPDSAGGGGMAWISPTLFNPKPRKRKAENSEALLLLMSVL